MVHSTTVNNHTRYTNFRPHQKSEAEIVESLNNLIYYKLNTTNINLVI